MLVTAKQVLVPARQKHYAVPAFNVNDLEFLRAVMDAAVRMKSPVIVQTSEGAIAYAGMDYLVAMVRVAAQAKIPVVMHLDHGKDLKVIRQAIQSGYTSVMIDGSALPYAKNVAATKKVVAWARAKRVSIEAEIGALAGIEDFVSVADADAHLTNPQEAARFARETHCDSLAVAIGTSHGAFKFKGNAELRIDILKKTNELVKIPLTLHGASGVPEFIVKQAEKYGAKLDGVKGVPDSHIKLAIKNGITKINTDTDIRIAFDAAVRKFLADNPKDIDPRHILKPARELIAQVAMERIKLFGSANKG